MSNFHPTQSVKSLSSNAPIGMSNIGVNIYKPNENKYQIHRYNRNGKAIEVKSKSEPMKAMIFIDGTWIYYSLMGREDCPFQAQYGRTWRKKHKVNWKSFEKEVEKTLNRYWKNMRNSERLINVVQTKVFTAIKDEKNNDGAQVRNDLVKDFYDANFDVHRFFQLDHGPEKCVDIALAVEMLYYATIPEEFDIAVIVTGDRDFIPALQKTRIHGKLTAVCTMKNSYHNDLVRKDLHSVDFDTLWIDDMVQHIVTTKPPVNRPYDSREDIFEHDETENEMYSLPSKRSVSMNQFPVNELIYENEPLQPIPSSMATQSSSPIENQRTTNHTDGQVNHTTSPSPPTYLHLTATSMLYKKEPMTPLSLISLINKLDKVLFRPNVSYLEAICLLIGSFNNFLKYFEAYFRIEESFERDQNNPLIYLIDSSAHSISHDNEGFETSDEEENETIEKISNHSDRSNTDTHYATKDQNELLDTDSDFHDLGSDINWDDGHDDDEDEEDEDEEEEEEEEEEGNEDDHDAAVAVGNDDDISMKMPMQSTIPLAKVSGSWNLWIHKKDSVTMEEWEKREKLFSYLIKVSSRVMESLEVKSKVQLQSIVRKLGVKGVVATSKKGEIIKLIMNEIDIRKEKKFTPLHPYAKQNLELWTRDRLIQLATLLNVLNPSYHRKEELIDMISQSVVSIVNTR